MKSAWVCVALLASCKAKEPEQTAFRPDGCLDLPSMSRYLIQADPNGGGLYWFDRVVARNYDGNDVSYNRLIRYDIAKHQTTVLRDRVTSPLLFTANGDPLFIQYNGDNKALVQTRPDGHMQFVTPDYFDVVDVEQIDPRRFAVLANADGKSAVYLLDLDRPRPTLLFDADVLLSATRTTIYVRIGDKSYAVDIATGAKEERTVPPKAMPDEEHAYEAVGGKITSRSMRTNDEPRMLVDDRRDYTLLHQTDSVLARAGKGDEHFAVWLRGGTATTLPRLRGGTSFVGVTKLGADTWAIVGHNTSNYDGDLYTLTHEGDICLIKPKTIDLEMKSRTLPARYAVKEIEFWAAAAKYPTARWQIFDYMDTPPAVSALFSEDGGDDLDKLRERAREVHKSVTTMFGDPELVTDLAFDDGRTATYRWRRERLKYRATAGIGDAKLWDPAEFDVTVTDLVDERTDDNKIKCSGKLTNVRTVTLVDLNIRCIGSDQDRVIPIAKIEPNQTINFSQTFDAKVADVVFVEVFQGREQLALIDLEVAAKDRALYDFFVKLHGDTRLALREHDFTKRFYVQLQTPEKQKQSELDLAMVAKAYDTIDKARAQFTLADPEAELELHIYVERKNYSWDGVKLALVE